MDILAPADFAAMLKPGARLLGIDLGTRTIGLAIVTIPEGMPTALHVIQRTKFMADKDQLLGLVAREKADGLVLGLPLNMDGTEGPRAQSTRAFARSLAPFTPLPLLFQDERLSTAEASGRLRIAGFDARHQKKLIDAAAAAVILEDALEVLAAHSN
ncbi:MAG: Holliday junction resolvase RuvX [Beijerinckiaceae bacterium]